jgi:hypothetical protein
MGDKPGGWAGAMIHSSSAAYASPYAHHAAPEGEGTSGGAAHEQIAFYSAADLAVAAEHGEKAHAGTFLGQNPHAVMYYVSAVVGAVGILIAAFLHGPLGLAGLFIGSRTQAARSRADALLPVLGSIAVWAQHKWYVDEFYNAVIRLPLLALAHISHLIDKLLVDGLVNLAGFLPRGAGGVIRPSQSGVLHGYAVGMAGGIAVLLIIVLLAMY